MKTKLPTIAGLLARYLLYIPIGSILAAVLLMTLFSENSNAGVFMTIVIISVIILAFIITDSLRFIPRLFMRNNRTKQVTSKLTPNSFTVGDWVHAWSPMFDTLENAAEGGRPLFQVSGQEWAFMDYEFDIRTHYKNGDFVSSHTYYSVLQIKLPRKLPHIVFDSKLTRGKQMRFKFDRNQRISLEGNFDNYFDTYFPAHYENDLLSIITPEVMEALIQANQFDIEIYSDSLKLYSSMKSPEQVLEMIQKAFPIRDKLMNNIITYSDSRLAADARKTVHTYGLTIQDNFRLKAVQFALGGAAVLVGSCILFLDAGTVAEQVENGFYGTLLLAVAGICFYSAVRTLKNGYEQRRQRAGTKDIPRTQPLQ